MSEKKLANALPTNPAWVTVPRSVDVLLDEDGEPILDEEGFFLLAE